MEESQMKYKNLIFKKSLLFQNNLADYLENSNLEKFFLQVANLSDKEVFFGRFPFILLNELHKIFIILKREKNYLEIEVYNKSMNLPLPSKIVLNESNESKDELQLYLKSFLDKLLGF